MKPALKTRARAGTQDQAERPVCATAPGRHWTGQIGLFGLFGLFGLVCLSSLLGFSGCVSVRIKPQQVNSPVPFVRGVPVCAAQQAGQSQGPNASASPTPSASAGPTLPLRLEQEGQECLAPVWAEAWWSVSNLAVLPGERYRLQIPAGQHWWDKGRRSDPAHGEPGNAFMNLLQSHKRLPQQPWMVLAAGVLNCTGADFGQAPLAPMPGPRADCHDTPAQVLGPQGLTLRVSSPGRLAFFGNDAAVFGGFFYRNNSGQVWVLVERLGP